jgi:peptidoglycan/LPS O-acetylase OafA/YrhL
MARLNSVDCLRGVAALAVLLHHAIRYERLPAGCPAWLRGLAAALDHGHMGVPLAFVVSGFCIHRPWARQYAESGRVDFDFRRFWGRRVRRLYPPYLFALNLSMAAVVVASLLGMRVPLVTNYPEPRLRWMGWDFLAHVGMLHGLHPAFDRAGGNPVYWTLARQEYLYLLYLPLLTWRRLRGPAECLLGVFVLGLAFPEVMRAVVGEGSAYWGQVQTSAVVFWVQWYLGALAVEAYYGIVMLPRWCYRPALVPVWAVLAAVSPDPDGAATQVLWGLTFFTLLNACVAREKAGRWPAGRFVGWLSGVGVFSYSLYLVHNPIRYVGKVLMGPLALTTSPALFLANAAALAALGYFGGKLFYAYVEARLTVKAPSPGRPAAPIPHGEPVPVMAAGGVL